MTDQAQPDNTEWVITKHTKLLNTDEVIGRYPTREDAYVALYALRANHQLFTSYNIEHRNKE